MFSCNASIGSENVSEVGCRLHDNPTYAPSGRKLAYLALETPGAVLRECTSQEEEIGGPLSCLESITDDSYKHDCTSDKSQDIKMHAKSAASR